jgi:ribonuclease VapC
MSGTALVVDTSAVIALLEMEAAAPRIAALLAATDACLMSVANALEATIVMRARRGELGVQALDTLLTRAGIELVPIGREQLSVARDGHRQYGKGRHPAALNFGDCFAWALASERALPLLFVGSDFSRAGFDPLV